MGRGEIGLSRRFSALLSRRGALASLIGLTFLLLTVVPLMPYQAECFDETVPGPYRKVYVDNVAYWFRNIHIYYWRFGNTILLRVLPIFDGNAVFDRSDAILNTIKIADDLSEDVRRDGVFYPAPPAVKRLKAEHPDTYRHVDLCRAAVRFSPTDPPAPPTWWERFLGSRPGTP